MIRVLLADDQELVRSGFSALIDAEKDMQVVGEASTGLEAVELAVRSRPDVILMDIRMPDLDGVAATERITAEEHLRDTRVIMLTTFDLDQYVYGAIRAGASGFLLKDTSPVKLLEAVRVVAEGDALIAPSVTRRIIQDLAVRPDPEQAQAALADLTEREVEVLTEIGRGGNNNEIGEALLMSPLTAKTHVSRLLTKLRARDRAQLVVVAYETGLVVPGE